MQISKQQFNKLSKADKAMLMSQGAKKASAGKGKKKVSRPNTGNRLGRGQDNLLPGVAIGVASSYAKGVKATKPRIQYSSTGRECRVVHKEFITNVVGSVNFTTPIQVQLNPGLVGSFPWLSNIANNFEQYRVNALRFCYMTRTGTSVPGSVLMYPDYDAADSAPLTEQIASAYAEIVEDAPWKDNMCILRPAGMHALGPRKFIRNSAVAASDIKTYDVGTFYLSTVDGTAVPWGKVWIEYDISFYEPQLNPQGSFIASSLQGTAGTAASLVSAGFQSAGPLISGLAGNVISLQNLIIGAEYSLTAGATASVTNCTFSSPVGLTLKNTFTMNSLMGATYIATASVGSVTATLGGNVTNPLIVIAQIAIGVL